MNIDLNLLKILTAIDQCGSVSAAARQLGMSQSGASGALARLRMLLGDELFVRTGPGMRATPRAQAILADTHELMERLQAGLAADAVFDPQRSRPTFRLAMSDIGEMSILPALLADLQSRAPGCTVHVEALAVTQLKQALESGAVDVAVGYLPDLEVAGFYQQQLFMHGFDCLVRTGHALGSQLSLQEYEDAGHVVVHTPVRSQDLVERYIAQQGIRRRVVLHTPHFMSLPVIIGATDLVATIPSAVGTVFAKTALVRVVKLPFDSPQFAVKQHWHRRFHREPRNRWLRARLHALFNGQWQLFLGARPR